MSKITPGAIVNSGQGSPGVSRKASSRLHRMFRERGIYFTDRSPPGVRDRSTGSGRGRGCMHSLSRGTIGAKLQIVWQETRGMPRLHIGAPAGFLRNARTGAIRIAALFANPDNTLRPGQYARVR